MHQPLLQKCLILFVLDVLCVGVLIAFCISSYFRKYFVGGLHVSPDIMPMVVEALHEARVLEGGHCHTKAVIHHHSGPKENVFDHFDAAHVGQAATSAHRLLPPWVHGLQAGPVASTCTVLHISYFLLKDFLLSFAGV